MARLAPARLALPLALALLVALALFVVFLGAACGAPGIPASAPAEPPEIGPGDLSVARVGHTATVLTDGRVVVIGGANTEVGIVAAVEIYDPASGSWSSAGDIPTVRAGHTATLLHDGRVVVVGGVGVDGYSPVTQAALLDPQTGVWSSAGVVLTPRTGHTATLLRDGRVLIVGEDNVYEPYAELFDPATGEWSPTGPSAGPRFRHSATLTSDGRVLVTGGEPSGQESGLIDLVEIFDPATDSWSLAGNLQVARSRHSASLLGDGRIVVLGGASETVAGPGGALAAGEAFDPETGEWTAITPACSGRFGHSAILLDDGRLVLLGGQSDALVTTSVESYDPETDRWSLSVGTKLGRVGASASALHNGSLLVAGGSLRSSYEVSTLREDPEVQTSALAIHPTALDWAPCAPFEAATPPAPPEG